MMVKLSRDFYLCDSLTLAKSLLGKVIVTKINGIVTSGIISETEAYMGEKDKASHAYGGRRTNRTETMYMAGGHAYVYLIYGMYNCMNVVANKEETPEAVLIRGVVPYEGVLHMMQRRAEFHKQNEISLPKNRRQLINISNGPGKLCVCLGIDRTFDKTALWGENMYICDNGFAPEKEPDASKRVNIDYAEEAADFLWRFSLADHDLVEFCNYGGTFV